MSLKINMKLTVVSLVIYTTIFAVLINGYDCKIVQFIFGDSLSDVGNNNYLSKSIARASLPWYGIDFGNGLPNGRFSNGRTVADIVGNIKISCHAWSTVSDSTLSSTVLSNLANTSRKFCISTHFSSFT